MLKSEVQNLQHKTSKSSMKVDYRPSADLIKIMSNVDNPEVSPFMKLFWEKQQKYLNIFCKNINPLSFNDNSILFSFTSNILCN